MHKNKYIPWEPWTYEFVGHESKIRLFWLAHWITWVSIEKPGFSQQCLKNGFEKYFLNNCGGIAPSLTTDMGRLKHRNTESYWWDKCNIRKIHVQCYKRCTTMAIYMVALCQSNSVQSKIRQTYTLYKRNWKKTWCEVMIWTRKEKLFFGTRDPEFQFQTAVLYLQKSMSRSIFLRSDGKLAKSSLGVWGAIHRLVLPMLLGPSQEFQNQRILLGVQVSAW